MKFLLAKVPGSVFTSTAFPLLQRDRDLQPVEPLFPPRRVHTGVEHGRDLIKPECDPYDKPHARSLGDSLQVIPGVEFHLIRREVSAFLQATEAGGVTVRVGDPLLSGYDEAVRVARALISDVPKERKSSDAVVFMGHGSRRHPADLFYVALNSILKEKDPLAFLGTVEGHPTLDDIVKKCKAAGCTKAWLIPFMAVAGDHAINDMAGDGEDSWKSILEKAGIGCTPVLRGVLDSPGVRDVWLDNLADIVSRK